MNIKKHSTPLDTGGMIEYRYDKDGDFLEIFFEDHEASAAIELTDSIVLRFDWDTCTPLSLGVICFSRLLEPAPYGEKHFALLVDEWPDEVHDKIWYMMRQSPLTEILTLRSYIPPNTDSIIPMAAMSQLPAVTV